MLIFFKINVCVQKCWRAGIPSRTILVSRCLRLKIKYLGINYLYFLWICTWTIAGWIQSDKWLSGQRCTLWLLMCRCNWFSLLVTVLSLSLVDTESWTLEESALSLSVGRQTRSTLWINGPCHWHQIDMSISTHRYRTWNKFEFIVDVSFV